MKRRRTAGRLIIAAVLVTVAGCGAHDSASDATSATTGPALGVGSLPPGAAATAREADSDVPQCATADLRASLGQETAAAGTVAFPIVFTNAGSGPCVVEGFPGVSYATGPDSEPVGAPAARDGGSAGPVRLAPGEQASSLVFAADVHNIPPDRCRPVAVPGLRIYPPDNTASVYLDRAATACGNGQMTTAQLRVRAVVAGARGQ